MKCRAFLAKRLLKLTTHPKSHNVNLFILDYISLRVFIVSGRINILRLSACAWLHAVLSCLVLKGPHAGQNCACDVHAHA